MTKDAFAALHQSGEPLVLFNIWDAGSASVVAEAGAKAIATGSLSLAGAQGFDDGEAMPFEALLATVRQIAGASDLPLTVDFETGFASDLEVLATNARALHEAGAIGCNLEDRLIGQGGLRGVAEQCERIAAVAAAGLFVNARTDAFLGPLMAGENPNQPALVEQAIARAAAYRQAGAGCFFVPGLSDPDLIAQLCGAVDLPVNVMRLDGMPSNAAMGALGVARISYGPGPWRHAMAQLADAAKEALGN
ncbi:isocitrate lyase/PEP mutase family protein [Parerythrobacter jejuensis]|uniref:Isocitrate lyase/phosphoenolpyruvate mutase family protein n=1 Tax=Parerythrobacter jejuensis TaxID=795812 RepID=A0A845AUV8_9SPHN|nr:isocitrate lyase/phosphoenolpyruvate mutase family protein [Parerythrobacter jejuensis]MXP32855.1 isocitrate lyase/phosphoenolpyruvate mutase family protein [Parerythrobacter jejuensis]